MATYIIAEIGVNHNGSMEKAQALIDASVAAGADCVKFQTFCAEQVVTHNAPKADYQKINSGGVSQLEMLKGLELSKDEQKILRDYSRKAGVDFLSTAFDAESSDFLISLGIKAIKVASGEITNRVLLEYFASQATRHQLPVYLSTGMSSLGEVEQALDIFLLAGVMREYITILHCVSAYPADKDKLNLQAIQTLKSAFKCKVGYSDHSLGITAPIVAVALGASIIEKHITLDRTVEGPDHAASLEPTEFKNMVTGIREAEVMMGDGIKRIQCSEENTKIIARRGVYAACNIKKGDTISLESLSFIRPFAGTCPMQYERLVGRQASRSYSRGDALDE
jgi:N-acetylneuraminate synthase